KKKKKGKTGTNWEGGHRIPFLARWPGRIPAGTVNSQLATTMDLLPTLLAMTGSPETLKNPIDGHDISGLLTNPQEPSPTSHFFYYMRGTLLGVREGPWKLIRPFRRQQKGKPAPPTSAVGALSTGKGPK
ncbi:MAG: sulfatase-like hydrolase/transferase, partial [Verrucomicrobiota bacterium]